MILDIAAEMASLLEPFDDVTKIVLDREPISWEPETLYVYPLANAYVGIESGPTVRQDFELRAVYVTATDGEEARRERDPELAAYLDDKANGYMEKVRHHQQAGTWMHVSPIAEDGPRMVSSRSVAIRLPGYRIVT